jgi:tripartite ATP-independent transporter DctM subunit
MAWLLAGIVVGAVMLGVPVAFALVAASVVFLYASGLPLELAVQSIVGGMASFPVLAVPLFAFAGVLLNESGVATRMYQLARDLVGHYRAGLAHVNILTSVLFSGMSGSAIADVAATGSVDFRNMRRYGYPDDFIIGVTGTSAVIGPLMPPSIPAIVYGVVAGVSVGDLFIAGIVPALLMAFLLFVFAIYKARRLDLPGLERAPLGQVVRSFVAFVPGLFAIVIIIGGIWSGWFTPTEAAAVAVVWVLLLGVVYRELTFPGLLRAAVDAGRISAAVLVVVGAAGLYGMVLTRSGIARGFTSAMVAISDESVLVALLLINLVLLVAGLFFDTASAILLLVPLLLPVTVAVGLDPVQFGVIVTLNLMIGALTPPVGPLLFTLVSVGGISVEKAFRGVLPWMVPIVACLALISWFPDLSLWLVRLGS